MLSERDIKLFGRDIKPTFKTTDGSTDFNI